MKKIDDASYKSDLFQIDETYIGGKESNKNANKKIHARRGAVGKTAVVGMRGQTGNVYAKPVANNKAGTFQDFLKANAPIRAYLVKAKSISVSMIQLASMLKKWLTQTA